MITLHADFNHMDAGGRLRLGDLRMHQQTPFAEIAAKHETIIFVDGEDMVRGELVYDPEHGWIGPGGLVDAGCLGILPVRRRRSRVIVLRCCSASLSRPLSPTAQADRSTRDFQIDASGR